jgi:hypothetical protein
VDDRITDPKHEFTCANFISIDKFIYPFSNTAKFVILLLLIPGLIAGASIPASSNETANIQQNEPTLSAQDTSPSPPRSIFRASDASPQVYELVPDLPLENYYISVETGEVLTTSTLASRLIRYHTLVRGRSLASRLDWKLTLADYLGANEWISILSYPGHDTLRTNPMQNDIAAIGQLNRAQRDILVEALVSVFTPNQTDTSTSRPSVAPPSTITPSSTPTSPSPIHPRPGDAQLLLP